MTTFVVTRHAGAVEWLRARGYDGAQHRLHFAASEAAKDDVVVGTLPIHIVASVIERGARYVHLTMDIPAHLRGAEMTPEMMDECNAHLQEYTASAVFD